MVGVEAIGGTEDAKPERPRLRGPDFICFGAQKAGTRWLFDQLDAHPDFWMPPIKELHYFNRPSSRKEMAQKLQDFARDLKTFNRTRRKKQHRPLRKRDLDFLSEFLSLADHPVNYDNYAGLFDRKGDRLSGDVTPGYSALDDDRVAKIAAHFPDARYVFIARDPVRRFWSQVNMHVYKERIDAGMGEKTVAKLLSKSNYQKRSYQSVIFARWKRFVPADHLALYFFDDLVADPAGLRRRIISFLGGAPDKPSGDLPPDFNRKDSKSPAPMPDPMKHLVAARLAGELRACAAAFGGPAEAWPRLYGL